MDLEVLMGVGLRDLLKARRAITGQCIWVGKKSQLGSGITYTRPARGVQCMKLLQARVLPQHPCLGKSYLEHVGALKGLISGL